MNYNDVINRFNWVERYLTSDKYKKSINEAASLIDRGLFDSAFDVLCKLPTIESLTDDLVNKLKGKSVYKTIKMIMCENKVDDITMAKGISSLITHAIIEMNNSPEYLAVIKVLIERLNSIVYGMK